jgi:hypothetical protein
MYALAKVLGALLIYLFWRTLIRALRGGFPKPGVIAFLVLFAAALIAIVALYPAMYEYEVDDLIVYYNATQYVPLYWHHYLTGCVYAASYLLFPHPIVLPIVQSALFSGLVASVFARLYSRFGGRRAWPAFLLIVAPASYYLALSPYRNCLFTILCLYVFSELLFLFVDGRAPDRKQLALLIPAFAVIAVWRSEGLLYLLLLPVALLTLGRFRWVKTILLTALAGAIALALLLPQRYGMANAEDGMGKNYSLISAMNALQDIYLDENVNLGYDGAEADSAVIDSFVPLELLEEYGLKGFRYYNMSNGRRINYSGRSDADIAAFMGAYRRIVLHNLSQFLRAQTNRACEALGLLAPFAYNTYGGEPSNVDMSNLYKASSVRWEQGRDSLVGTTFWTLDTAHANWQRPFADAARRSTSSSAFTARRRNPFLRSSACSRRLPRFSSASARPSGKRTFSRSHTCWCCLPSSRRSSSWRGRAGRLIIIRSSTGCISSSSSSPPFPENRALRSRQAESPVRRRAGLETVKTQTSLFRSVALIVPVCTDEKQKRMQQPAAKEAGGLFVGREPPRKTVIISARRFAAA